MHSNYSGEISDATNVQINLSGNHIIQLGDNLERIEVMSEITSSILGRILYCFARSGNLERFQVLLERIDHPDRTKCSIMFRAHLFTCLNLFAGEGNLEMIQLLLDKGVDIREKNSNGTVLHEAARRGQLKVVQFLLDKEVNYLARNSRGYTALHLAAEKGHSEIVRALLNKDADIEARDNKGYTPLHLAAEKGHLKVVQALLNEDADVEVKSKNSSIVLHKSCRWLLSKIGQIWPLLEAPYCYPLRFGYQIRAQIKMKSKNGSTALHKAAEMGHSGIVQALLNKDADIEARDNKGYTPLHLAAEKGHSEIVQALLNKDADIEARDNKGYTALHKAAEKGHSEIVQVLLNENADVEAINNNASTPLHFAVRQGNLGVSKLLIRYHLIANLNAPIPNLSGIFRQELLYYWNNCKVELNKMKKKDNDLYDFLVTKNIDEQVRIWTESEKVQKILQNAFTIEYPTYAEDLTSKIQSAIFFLNNREIIHSLSNYYDTGIKTVDQAKTLFSRFIEEDLECDAELLLPQLISNTQNLQPSALKTLSFAQMINNHVIRLLPEDIVSNSSDLGEVKPMIPLEEEEFFDAIEECGPISNYDIPYTEEEQEEFFDAVERQESLTNFDEVSKKYVCGGGAILGLIIAYLAGATNLTPIGAIVVFIAAAAIGSLVGYAIGKFCDKVIEGKQNDPDTSTWSAVKSSFSDTFITKHNMNYIYSN